MDMLGGDIWGILDSDGCDFDGDLDWDMLAYDHEETSGDFAEEILADVDFQEEPDSQLDPTASESQESQCVDRYDDEDEGNEMDSRAHVIEQLENFVLDFLSQLSAALPPAEDPRCTKENTKKLVIELADRRKPCKKDGSMATRRITFPQKTKGASARPIAQLFRVVELMHEALVDNVPMTKRDMYYKDVPLFKSQGVVDKLVDDLAATFGVGRADLNVRASSKGLFCGAGLVMHLQQGESIQGNDSEGSLIPVCEEIARFDLDKSVRWILIVEKEAVFQTLCRLRFCSFPALPGAGIIITGKGYPDMATRELVCALSDNLPRTIPIMALVDGDPYGIDILSVYKYGSAAMAHEREKLAAPNVTWVGVWSSELAGLGLDKDALVPITKHDEKKALSMLRDTSIPKKWRKELQHMLHDRRKAEVEILSAVKPSDSSQLQQLFEPVQGNHNGSQRTFSGHNPLGQELALVKYLATKILQLIEDRARSVG